VRIREGQNFDQALAKLRELSQPLGGILSTTGQRNIDVTTEAGNLIRLTVSDPAITEKIAKPAESTRRTRIGTTSSSSSSLGWPRPV